MLSIPAASLRVEEGGVHDDKVIEDSSRSGAGSQLDPSAGKVW